MRFSVEIPDELLRTFANRRESLRYVTQRQWAGDLPSGGVITDTHTGTRLVVPCSRKNTPGGEKTPQVREGENDRV